MPSVVFLAHPIGVGGRVQRIDETKRKQWTLTKRGEMLCDRIRADNDFDEDSFEDLLSGLGNIIAVMLVDDAVVYTHPGS